MKVFAKAGQDVVCPPSLPCGWARGGLSGRNGSPPGWRKGNNGVEYGRLGQMVSFVSNWPKTSTLKLRIWWTTYGIRVMQLAVFIMAVVAVVWIGYQFYRLLWQPSQIVFYKVHPGAIDLNQRYKEVHDWFAGKPVYGQLKTATYPPASYLMLWPFLGWLDAKPALWFWAASTVVALGWLTFIVIRESGAQTYLEKAFVAFLPLSMYATGATIGNGQLIIHLLPLLLTGLLLLKQRQSGWQADILLGIMLLLALIKPTISAPFFWIVIFIPRRLRPILLVVFAYVVLTSSATLFQQSGVLSLIHEWFVWSTGVSAKAAVTLSHSNLHS